MNFVNKKNRHRKVGRREDPDKKKTKEQKPEKYLLERTGKKRKGEKS